MRKKYQYEEWENSVILLGRKLRREQNDKKINEDSHMENNLHPNNELSDIEDTDDGKVVVAMTLEDFAEKHNPGAKELSKEGQEVLKTIRELLEDDLITRKDFETRMKEIYLQYTK